jgi:RimJ/RimL family protein N-acetyltransferase
LTVVVPRLETSRLVLREFRPSDVEPYALMMANPEVCRFLGDGTPLDRADAWRQLAPIIGHWELRGFSLIRPGNRASIAVAEHFGARRTGSVELFGAVSDVYTYQLSA